MRSLDFKRKKSIPKKILSLRSMAFILFAYLVSFQVKIKVLMHDININLKEHAKIFTMELEFFSYHLHKINTMILRSIKYISYYFYDIRHFIFIHDLSLAKFMSILHFDCNFINNINLKELFNYKLYAPTDIILTYPYILSCLIRHTLLYN